MSKTQTLRISRPSLFGATALALVMLTGGLMLRAPAYAQDAEAPPVIEWDRKRLNQLDRNVRKLERALTQRNAAGDPVIIETDPEVVTLQSRTDTLDRRLEDLESTLRRLNGQLENTTLDLDQARKANNDLRSDLDRMRTRIAELETKVTEQAEAAAQAAAANAPPATTGDAAGDFAAAMQLMLNGDYAGAARGFEAVIQAWPDAPETPEAHYRLAETRFIAEDHNGAASAYAQALKGWPKTGWAPDATVKLATSLNALTRKTQACAALVEFTRRYAQTASNAVKARATALRTRATCAPVG